MVARRLLGLLSCSPDIRLVHDPVAAGYAVSLAPCDLLLVRLAGIEPATFGFEVPFGPFSLVPLCLSPSRSIAPISVSLCANPILAQLCPLRLNETADSGAVAPGLTSGDHEIPICVAAGAPARSLIPPSPRRRSRILPATGTLVSSPASPLPRLQPPTGGPPTAAPRWPASIVHHPHAARTARTSRPAPRTHLSPAPRRKSCFQDRVHFFVYLQPGTLHIEAKSSAIRNPGATRIWPVEVGGAAHLHALTLACTFHLEQRRASQTPRSVAKFRQKPHIRLWMPSDRAPVCPATYCLRISRRSQHRPTMRSQPSNLPGFPVAARYG